MTDRKALINPLGFAITLLITMVAFVDCGCGPAPGRSGASTPEMSAVLDSGKLSPEMSAVVRERCSKNWDVGTAGLPQLTVQESEDRVHRLELAGAMEVFPVPSAPGIQDAFKYVFWRDLTTNQYWIVRSGGLAGSTVVFGPGKFEKK